MSFPDIEMQKDSLTKYLAFKIIFQFTFFHLKKTIFHTIYKTFIAKQMDIIECKRDRRILANTLLYWYISLKKSHHKTSITSNKSPTYNS